MKKRGRFLIKVVVGAVIIGHLAMASIFAFHEFFSFTSSNSALYFLRGKTGGVELSRDLLFEDADRLIFMLDANCVFNYFMRGIAVAKGKPVLELTWNAKEGVGDIKQFRADGNILSFSFSRFKEEAAKPHGLFLGGDLPYGDISRSLDQSTSGMGFYDGSRWAHIWCAANEGFSLAGKKDTLLPALWKFTGSRVIKTTEEEVILESEHEAAIEGLKVLMKRLAYFRAGEDYFVLKVRFINPNTSPITYSYAYGDEPWVGTFGASGGDVGWVEGGLVKYETFISPSQTGYAGFWDYGNDAAGEPHNYTGYANFIEWVSPQPTYVFFSNDLEHCCKEFAPLQDPYSRSLNIVWLNKLLLPAESRDHIFAVGMAKTGSEGLPEKPPTVLR
jgi:hypothetical protein